MTERYCPLRHGLRLAGVRERVSLADWHGHSRCNQVEGPGGSGRSRRSRLCPTKGVGTLRPSLARPVLITTGRRGVTREFYWPGAPPPLCMPPPGFGTRAARAVAASSRASSRRSRISSRAALAASRASMADFHVSLRRRVRVGVEPPAQRRQAVLAAGQGSTPRIQAFAAPVLRAS